MMVELAVVGTRSEAELLTGLLRSGGVHVAVGDDAGRLAPPRQHDGFRVLVAADDEARARRLLAAVDTDLEANIADI